MVTGAAYGIGAAYCRALADEGSRIALVDIDAQAIEDRTAELEKAGAEVLGAVADVTDLAALEAVRHKVVARWGQIHGLVNNAAMFATVPMNRGGYDSIDVAEWDKMMAVNVKGTWLATRAFVPAMKGYGKIVNISSGVALKGVSGRIHYVASKAAVLGITRTLASELGGDGIRVNCIAPGNTLSEANPDDETRAMRDKAAKSRALSRTQLPEDLLGAVLFFLSPASDFITGQTLVVDGGDIMH